MQHLEVSGAVRPLKWSLGVKWLIHMLVFLFDLHYAETLATVHVSGPCADKTRVTRLVRVSRDTSADSNFVLLRGDVAFMLL